MNDFFNSKKSVKDGVQFAWDATSLSMAQKCPRYYYYKMVRGLQPRSLSVHLLFGGLYATALEHFYTHRAEGDDIDAALRKVIREAMINSWEHPVCGRCQGTGQIQVALHERDCLDCNGTGALAGGAPKSFDHNAKTRPNLIRTIVWYIEQFADEQEDGIVTHHLASGKPAVELSFTIEASDSVYFCGHLDRVVRMGDDLFVADQKTTGGTVGPYFFQNFSPDMQMSLYSWAGATVLQSPVRGVIIDAAQVAVNFTRFERGITTRTKDQLAEWYDTAMHTIELTNSFVRDQRFPMNLASCGNYGGCEFRGICSRSPSVRENFLKADFTAHNWDPLEAR